MTEEITAQSTFDVATMLPAYRWHRRKRLRWFWPTVIILIVLLTLSKYIVGAEDISRIDWVAVAPFPIVLGLYAVVRKYILNWNISRSLKRMPAYGKSILWTIREGGFDHQLGETQGFTEWPMIYESVGTPEGALVYPQKNLFYWLPKSGFTSQRGYERFLELIQTKTKYSAVR